MFKTNQMRRDSYHTVTIRFRKDIYKRLLSPDSNLDLLCIQQSHAAPFCEKLYKDLFLGKTPR